MKRAGPRHRELLESLQMSREEPWRALNAEPGCLCFVGSLSSVNIIGFAVHVGLHSPPFLVKPEAEAGDPWLFNCPQDHGLSYSYVGAKAVRLELKVELGRQQQATSLETDV